MSRGLNKVMLIGHLGQDPELRYIPSGTAVTNVSLATNESRSDANGERRDHTEWHRVVFFGRLAEVCCQYLNKGSQVFVEGRLHTREWDRGDGIKRYTTEIVARDMQMLSPRGSSGGQRGSENDDYAQMAAYENSDWGGNNQMQKSPAPQQSSNAPMPQSSFSTSPSAPERSEQSPVKPAAAGGDYEKFDDDVPF